MDAEEERLIVRFPRRVGALNWLLDKFGGCAYVDEEYTQIVPLLQYLKLDTLEEWSSPTMSARAEVLHNAPIVCGVIRNACDDHQLKRDNVRNWMLRELHYVALAWLLGKFGHGRFASIEAGIILPLLDALQLDLNDDWFSPTMNARPEVLQIAPTVCDTIQNACRINKMDADDVRRRLLKTGHFEPRTNTTAPTLSTARPCVRCSRMF